MYATLSNQIADHVIGATTTSDLWSRIRDYFLANRAAQYMMLNRQYRNLKQGDLFVEEYTRRMKLLTAGLADIDHAVSEVDLTTQFLHDIDGRLDMIRVVLGDTAYPMQYSPYQQPSWDHMALLHAAYSNQGFHNTAPSNEWYLDSGASNHVTGNPGNTHANRPMEGEAATTSGVVSLADYLGTNVADHIPETPNNLSEEMVRCMAGVYCKLADPPLVHHRASSSPTSSLSSTTSVVSPQYLGDMWSPNCRREATLDSRLINPFHVEGLKEFSGPYNTMVEVPSISRDRPRLREVEDLLQTYKLILHRLESVDLRRMANEEKLAFWINIHNALLMHAYLKHGIPQNHLKKTSLLVKAECKIAGRSINAAAIQGLVLGCSTHCPGQVRVYTPKRLFQQLEAAKEEYIRATVGVRPPDHQHRRGRVLLPKLVEAYARDVGLSPERLLDAAQRCLPESVRAAVQRCRPQQQQHQGTTASKAVVEWAPHRQSFRYLLARDLAFPHLS
ncbi:hypothetical protein TRIUR3_21471 [Triticum urartu]|uniref:Uncharacterized protein n=1 Tax=Triticum urartu TaxID=4572 RepID=M7ZE18_TRIUA|nr:hypothetical protein TRIUR3_21471 [Triticum urartu]